MDKARSGRKTASAKNVQNYRLEVVRETNGAHIEVHQLMQGKKICIYTPNIVLVYIHVSVHLCL